MYVQSTYLCTYGAHCKVYTHDLWDDCFKVCKRIRFEREREREMRRKDKFLSQDDLGVALGSKNSTDQTTSGEQFSDIM